MLLLCFPWMIGCLHTLMTAMLCGTGHFRLGLCRADVPTVGGLCARTCGLVCPCCRPTLLILVQLELANMLKNGDLQSMWAVARQTNLTFNMVGAVSAAAGMIHV